MAKTDGSVPAMINVESAAAVRWGRELNSVYRRVLAKLNPAGQQSLGIPSESGWPGEMPK